MVTIKDIAKQLGISISTVSKGLNGASDISEEMRQLVLDTALEMGYVTKNKRPTIRHKVAIIVENMEYENINQFGYEIMTGFRLAANEQQYEVSIIPVDLYFQAKQSYDNMMIQNGYSGAFILGFDLTDVYINQLQSTTIPTVLFDNYICNKHVGYIGTDNTAGIDALIQHLYDLGHRKIAFLNGAKHSFITGRRFDLIQKAVKSLDLELNKSLIAYGEYDPSTAKKYVNDFINNGATAIVCGSDLIASGVINELHRIGKRVPEDISVTGFDDLPLAKYLAPPLTTVRQERFTLGKLAFMLLNNLIHNISITTLLLQSELIIRETTGPCKDN